MHDCICCFICQKTNVFLEIDILVWIRTHANCTQKYCYVYKSFFVFEVIMYFSQAFNATFGYKWSYFYLSTVKLSTAWFQNLLLWALHYVHNIIIQKIFKYCISHMYDYMIHTSTAPWLQNTFSLDWWLSDIYFYFTKTPLMRPLRVWLIVLATVIIDYTTFSWCYDWYFCSEWFQFVACPVFWRTFAFIPDNVLLCPT